MASALLGLLRPIRIPTSMSVKKTENELACMRIERAHT